MKALSLHQPWAELILTGHKTIETRRWHTLIRGDILICSTQKRDKDYPYLPYGTAICIAELYKCDSMHTIAQWDAAMCDPYENPDGYVFGFYLRNIRPIFNFDVRGRQRFFNVDDADIERFKKLAPLPRMEQP